MLTIFMTLLFVLFLLVLSNFIPEMSQKYRHCQDRHCQDGENN